MMRRLMMRNARSINRGNFFFWTYLATLFLSFHYFFITYINSSVLSSYVGEDNIGILYIAGSLLTITIFLNIARILKRWGNYRMMLFLLVIKACAIFGLAVFHNPAFIIISFIVSNSLYPILFMSLDTFIDHYSRPEGMGKIRGMFLTIMNGAAIVCPIAVGFLIEFVQYRGIYFLSLFFILSLFIIVRAKFKNFRDTEYHTAKGITIIKKFLKDKNIRQIFVVGLMLQIFYSFLIIYVPIYLLNNLHFSWPQIGIAISISLLPFVIFEIPLGELADESIGEKEIILVGFLIMIGAVTIMGITQSYSLILWISLLSLARTGASFVEVASDTYFFKKIDHTNDELISFWRITTPLGYILGTIAGSMSLILLPFQFIFFALAIILIVGLIYSAKIKDTL